jgi:hypothetical protein
MFCVIQKVINKRPDPNGAPKELLVISRTLDIDGVTKTSYSYSFSKERFERKIKDAYKIIIHHSFREKGVVKKKQWVICTMGYYDLINSIPNDHINTPQLKSKLEEMDITEEQLWNIVHKKLQPIVDYAKEKFGKTKEFLTARKHENILHRYRVNKKGFQYAGNSGDYDYCYDVFGVLRNEEYLNNLIKKSRADFEEFMNRSSSSRNKSQSNYSDISSYFKSTYSDEEKVMLKTIYRALSKSFHPDITQDDGQMMKLINRLKEGWGI